MNETAKRPALPAEPGAFGDMGALSEMESGYGGGMMMPVAEGHQSASLAGLGMVMSLPVIRPRNHGVIMQNLRQLCAANGQRYVYSWEVRNRGQGTKDTIEGPTIKLANDLARTYGNCFAGVVDVRNAGDYWEFVALFLDRETGFAMARSFQQRKTQNTGMKDADRQRDIVYQIGASKAIRNVVVNALQSYVEYMMDESRKCLVDWVANNGDKAQAYIDKACQTYDLDIKRVEAFVGRPRDQWVNRDIATVMMRLRAVDEGQANVADVFPSPEDIDDINADKEARGRKETRASAKREAEGGKAADPARGKAAAGGKAGPAKAKEPDPEPARAAETVDPETGEVTEGGAAAADATTQAGDDGKPRLSFGDE